MILLVDDWRGTGESLKLLLEAEGEYQVLFAWKAAQARRLLIDHATEIRAAVLDWSLDHGETAEPIADALDAHGIPYLFISGWEDIEATIPGKYDNVPQLKKPPSLSGLITILRALVRDGEWKGDP